MNHWLVKQEPESYAWSTFVADGRTTWEGVRNFQARNHLRGMKRGDAVLFYASGGPKSVVGIARVAREPYPDPSASADEGDWSAVDLEPVATLKTPVPLATIKATSSLKDILLVRHSRLSVMPLTADAFETIVELGGGRQKLK
jgi:predicted RNA-binding protein with PUA-like domain